MPWMGAESNTRPFGEKQGAFVIVAIHLPTKPHTHHPVSNGGVFSALGSTAQQRRTLQAVTSEPMNFDTLMALCLLEQLVAALRANDPDTFKRWQAQEHQEQQ